MWTVLSISVGFWERVKLRGRIADDLSAETPKADGAAEAVRARNASHLTHENTHIGSNTACFVNHHPNCIEPTLRSSRQTTEHSRVDAGACSRQESSCRNRTDASFRDGAEAR